jgi:hypothetical protein
MVGLRKCRNKVIMQGNNKDKTVIKGKAEMHLYMTLQLLAPKLLY